MPTPATAKSHSIRRPDRVTTASTRLVPSKATTSSPASSSTPFARWMALITPATWSPRTRSSGSWPGKIAVTRTPSWVSDAATSQPMNPIPTITAVRPRTASCLIESHSATVRR